MNSNISEQVKGHLQRNELLKNSLLSKGVKLNEKRSLELHFWAKNQREAVMLAKALYDQNMLILVLAPVSNDNVEKWNIEAGYADTVENLIDPHSVERFVELASKFDALYDGWGTRI